MTATARKRLFTVLRVVICVLALWFVARGVTLDDTVVLQTRETLRGSVARAGGHLELVRPDGSVQAIPNSQVALDADGAPRITYGLRTSWRAGRKDLLLLALCLQFPVALILGLRLRWMLSAQDVRLGYWDCIKLSFAGNFLNFATPLGSNAGDVFKAYFVALHTHRKTEAVTTIALDRILGLGTLLLVVAVIAVVSPSDSRLAPFRAYTLTVLGIGAVAALIYLSPLHRIFGSSRLTSRFPVLAHVRRIDAATRALIRRVPLVACCIVATVALQALALGSYFVVAIAFGMEACRGNAMEYYAYFATGAVVQALPGPPQGLGTVELTYRYFFAPFGSASQILCVAFFIRVLVPLLCAPGALVTLTGAYKPRSNREDSQTAEPLLLSGAASQAESSSKPLSPTEPIR